MLFRFLCLFVFVSIAFDGQSQIFEKGLKGVFGGKNNKPESQSQVDKRDQSEIIQDWEEGLYNYYSASPSQQNTSPIATSKNKLHIVKNEDGTVKEVWFGEDIRVEKMYRPENYRKTETVLSFKANNSHLLCFTKNAIISYAVKENGKTVNNKNGEGDDGYAVDYINYILGKSMRYKQALNYVQNYRNQYYANYQAELERKRQEQAEDYAQNTLKGKEIESIKVINEDGTPLTAVNYNGQSLNFEVTFADGSVNKTRKAGGSLYIDDFGCEIDKGTESVTSNDYESHLDSYGLYMEALGKVYPKKNSISDSDLTDFKVYSKYSPDQKFSVTLPLAYSDKASLSFSGGQGNTYSRSFGTNGGRGGDGGNVTVLIDAFRHSETHETVYVVKAGSYFKYFTESLHVSAAGGDGGDGERGDPAHKSDGYKKPGNGGNGGDGGNGGNITIQIDPKVSVFPQITTDVSAGRGGLRGSGGTCWSCLHGNDGAPGRSGSSGKSGTVKRTSAPVNFQ